MNRLVLFVFAAALLMLPIAGAAQTATPAATSPAVHTPTVKIGWINVEQAILTCDEGAKMVADVQKFVDAKNAELTAMRQEAEDLAQKLNVQGAKLTDDARMDLEEKARAKETQLQRFSDDTNRDIEARKQRISATISRKMGPIIEKVAIAKGLDAIEIINPSRDAWINPALNVTQDLIKAYNQAYPAGAVAPAAKKP